MTGGCITARGSARLGRALALVGLLAFATGTAARELPTVKPAAEGFSAERLARLPQVLHGMVDAGELAGIVSLVARHGRIVHFDTYGAQDLESGTPLEPDTIFRIYSMTKPVTGVAMMMLYEEGKWHPEEPLSRYIPEFADLKVHAGTDAGGVPVLEAPAHPPTVGELMTHTAGFTYGFFGDTPVDEQYRQRKLFEQRDLQAFIETLAEVPLAYQPGTQWRYSLSVDIQGYLVEKLSGQSLPDFMRERIFAPLDMPDTAFHVPPAKMPRLATVYRYAGETGLAAMPHDAGVNRVPGLPSGGGGLYGTARDYLRFAQMLANGGILDGQRLLAPATVALMTDNHLTEALQTGGFGIGWQQMRPGFGFGYDVAVYDDPHRAGSITGTGTFLWDGAAGTWFWVDPERDIVFVGMIQRLVGGVGLRNIQKLSRTLVQQALVDP